MLFWDALACGIDRETIGKSRNIGVSVDLGDYLSSERPGKGNKPPVAFGKETMLDEDRTKHSITFDPAECCIRIKEIAGKREWMVPIQHVQWMTEAKKTP